MGGAVITTKFKETAAAAVQAGLNPSRLTVVREFLESPLKRLAKAFNITEKQAEDLQKYVRDFRAEAKLIRPGEKYTWTKPVLQVLQMVLKRFTGYQNTLQNWTLKSNQRMLEP